MTITIQNDNLVVVIDSYGAQIMELCSSRGRQYLWDGDEKYWADRSPVLFPFVGRLTEKSYTLDGKVYGMDIHGFASKSEFAIDRQTSDSVTLKLSDDDRTYKQYPRHFELLITYRLAGNTLETSYRVLNRGEEDMHFGIGGHPGFRVPFSEGTDFEDYYLRFDSVSTPDRVGFSPACFLNGEDRPYPLTDGRIIPLRHSLFDEDAIVLKNMAPSVSLCSDKADASVTVSYPQMPYLGLWHWPKTDAPYICIEPWTSLPARQDVIEDFACKSDMLHLPPGEIYENTWFITINEV